MSKSSPLSRALTHFLHFVPLAVVVLIFVPVVGMTYTETTKVLGLRTIPVEVVGTGSMYPSLFWDKSEGGPEDASQHVVAEYRTTPHLYHLYPGFTLFGHLFLHRTIGYGDIVSFKNSKTQEILTASHKDPSSGFIKRVIALPGDSVELRDGFVYLNGHILSEPYILSPRSTYGGTSLPDCSIVTVPPDSYFVLGDNRKISSDSRYELGFIKTVDIEFVLPYSEQHLYQALWRDPSHDAALLGEPTLSPTEFLTLANQARSKQGVGDLTYKSSLTESATLRGQHLLDNPKTTYDLKASLAAAGYSNIVLGEFVSYGHYTAQELLSNLLFNPSSSAQIMGKDYSDLGVADVESEVNGCPTQIIVGHLGGYLPASYNQAELTTWQNLRDNLSSILPSWEQAASYSSIDQSKLASLLIILRRRLSLADEVLTAMDHKTWLTSDQLARIQADVGDANVAEQLSKELNKQ